MQFDYQQAFSRNYGLISPEEQERLRNTTVAIPGMGGVGGIHLVTLARMGIGRFRIADADAFELANFNRQYGATYSNLGKSKVDVMMSIIKDINPEADIRVWREFIDQRNVNEFLQGSDLLIDSVDAFSIDARRRLYMTARALGIPAIGAGPVGFSCAMIVLTPDAMSFDDYFDYKATDTDEVKFFKFMLGLTPKARFLAYMETDKTDMNKKAGPSMASAVSLCAGFAATEMFKIILKRGQVNALPHYHYFDPYLMKFDRGYLPLGNRSPFQKAKLFFLKRFMQKRMNGSKPA